MEHDEEPNHLTEAILIAVPLSILIFWAPLIYFLCF